MKIQSIILSFLLAIAVIPAIGCGQSDEDLLADQGYSIELENGGFQFGQRAPGLAAIELEEQQVRTMGYTADDEQELQAEAGTDGGRPVFIVKLAWGQFPLDPQVQGWTRWNGLVYGIGAKVFVQRVIYYERHDFFQPCLHHDCVRIDSRTLPHHDGLLLKVVPYTQNPKLLIGFEGLYGRIIPLPELNGFSDIAVVDELGNQVVLEAFARPPCPAGMQGGVWKRLDERGGVFAGDWLDEEGLVAGKLAGIWGQRLDGDQVFFGVLSDQEGGFVGLLRGEYAEVPFVGGVYGGQWLRADGSAGGVLGGRIGPHPGGYPVTIFHGRFQAACGQGQQPAELPPPPTSDLDCSVGTCDSDGGVLAACDCSESPLGEAPTCTCAP